MRTVGSEPQGLSTADPDLNPPPLIGLTCSTQAWQDWSALYPGQPADYVRRDYSRAVETAGGLPVLLPVPLDPVIGLKTLPHLAGLILTGGEDVHPRCYGKNLSRDWGKWIISGIWRK